MSDFEILYVLEVALAIARRRRNPLLVYLITMAMIEAGGLPDTANDNNDE